MAHAEGQYAAASHEVGLYVRDSGINRVCDARILCQQAGNGEQRSVELLAPVDVPRALQDSPTPYTTLKPFRL